MTALLTRCTPSCQNATTPGCTCTCEGEGHGVARGLPVQMRLGLAVCEHGSMWCPDCEGASDVVEAGAVLRPTTSEPCCTECGLRESVAAAVFQIEAGRFCADCADELGLWR